MSIELGIASENENINIIVSKISLNLLKFKLSITLVTSIIMNITFFRYIFKRIKESFIGYSKNSLSGKSIYPNIKNKTDVIIGGMKAGAVLIA
ncbi:hypothetical protein RE474_03195 [Methanolobus sediminis]|uniref:Uncharacterized protein n=1 Tax=Methanolobus sediminis TaxID=3072978 RepID=A0AA51YM83_9EURY|nr:hypothetical protein [Methanolobus sediminis]WMW25739.1 hypothetical protein RE474_03195 [Methanolobus sediminis]